jgi:folate-binding protein YgfZ
MSHSTNDIETAVTNSSALFSRDKSRAFRLTGEDLNRYLQGRITQDISKLKCGDTASSLLLSPQGKVQGLFYLLKLEHELLLVTQPLNDEQAESFVKDLLLFKVADRVVVEELNETTVVRLCGPSSIAILISAGVISDSQGVPKNGHLELEDGSAYLIFKPNGQDNTIDIVAPNNIVSKIKAATTQNSGLIGNEADYTFFRIKEGTPNFPVDIDDKAIGTDIPANSLISFTKGCYAGQEVVEMSIARGKPNRKLARLTSDSSTLLEPGTELTANDKRVGKVTSCAIGPDGSLSCLALIKNDAFEEVAFCAGDVTLRHDGNLYPTS